MGGRSSVTGRGWAGSGIHPAMFWAHARAFVLSVIPGNRRRKSIAVERSPPIEGCADRGGIVTGELLQREPDLQSDLIALNLPVLDRTPHLLNFEPAEIS